MGSFSRTVCVILLFMDLLPWTFGIRCELICQEEENCFRTLIRLTKRECHKIEKNAGGKSAESTFNLSVSCTRPESTFTWPLIDQPDRTVILAVPKEEGRACVKITISDHQDTVKVNCTGVKTGRKKGRAVRVYDGATWNLLEEYMLLSIKARRRLKVKNRSKHTRQKQEKYVSRQPTEPDEHVTTVGPSPVSAKIREKKVKTISRPQGRPLARSQRRVCGCWSPKNVIIKPENNSVTVIWKEIYNRSDIRVGIVREEDTTTFIPGGFHILSVGSLLDKPKIQHTLKNLTLAPGRFIALVCALGCTEKCLRCTTSQTLVVGANKQIRKNTQIETDSSPPPPKNNVFTVSVIAVGVFAFVGVLTFLACIVLRPRGRWWPYRSVPKGELLDFPPVSLCDVQTFLLVPEANSEDAQNASMRLGQQLEDRGKGVIEQQQDHVNQQSLHSNQCIIYLCCGNNRSLPTVLKTATRKTVTACLIGRDLTMYFSPDCGFSDITNNARLSSVSRENFLSKIEPISLDTVLSDDQNARNRILLIRARDDGYEDIAEELKKLLERLQFQVVQPTEVDYDHDEIIGSARFCVVITSPQLTELINYNVGSSSLTEYDSVTLDILNSFHENRVGSNEVFLVSFEETVTRLDILSRKIDRSRTFQLVSGDDVTGLDLSLEQFFGSICGDTELVASVCDQGDGLLVAVRSFCIPGIDV